MKKATISYLLFILMLAQSCVVYQKASVILSETVDKGKVKIEKRQGLPVYYKNMLYEDGNYYGIYENKKVYIDTASISNIYLKDLKKSKRSTVIVFGVVLPVSIGLIVLWHASRSFGG